MPEVKILLKKNYLAMIENSVKGGNFLFKNKYALVDGEERDITKDGVLSCAVFVSSILYLNKLINDLHATVDGMEKDLVLSGWEVTDELKEGSVLVWEEEKTIDGSIHSHAGFYVGNNEAVSNSSNGSGVPVRHHLTYDGKRKIKNIYYLPSLT